ncbi:MAG: hypothetical protein RLN90_04410 [Balneolaceae bacterium]
MDTRVNIQINNKTDNKLTLYKSWGGPWGTEPPETIDAKSSINFSLKDNDRAGVVYLSTDSIGNEIGFVTMSFTCPKMTDNSAEGSALKEDIFISAGLQKYQESGTPVSFVYNVGEPNKACWSNSSSDNGKIECSQTKMETWTRVITSVNNVSAFDLDYVHSWGNTDSYLKSPISIPSGRKIIFMMNDNDRFGTYYRAKDNTKREIGYVTMSMTNPKLTSNSAEGSSETENIFLDAGLQKYDDQSPACFVYKIGTSNLACWDSGTRNNGIIECDETKLDGRVKIIIINENSYDLKFEKKWDESGDNDAWFFNPFGDILSNSHKTLILSTNDRAGVHYTAANMPFNLSFTCPKLTGNAAEGSPMSGLQTYDSSSFPAIFTYKIGNPNLACWDSGSKNNGKIECEQTKAKNILPNWMSKLKSSTPNFASKKISEVFWPGTHDSSCYDMSLLTPIPIAFTQTQFLSFLEQLNCGVRYFDLRLSWISEKSFRFYHGPANTNVYLDDLLKALETFYSKVENDKEIVILDFTHFYSTFDSDKKYQDFINVILNSSIKSKLVEMGTSSVTLSSIWSKNTNIIASVKYESFSSLLTQNRIWDGSYLFANGWSGTAFWPNTSVLFKMISFLTNILNQSYLGRLWVLQNILTPDTSIAGAKSIYLLSKEANPSLFENLVIGTKWADDTNIAIIDFYDEQLTIFAQYINWIRSK